ncbi:hypothetical protein [Brevibacterium oceani]|uniref:hypothetical protein n=1 Tax=Brevibacterium oceani TaxID=358099 RepID=UPI0015E64CDE|nr:hypothetical protein [Brevibacterium oceani]
MFPMTPVQSWTLIALLFIAVMLVIYVAIRLDADDRRPERTADSVERDPLADIPVWILDFDAEDDTPATFNARGDAL